MPAGQHEPVAAEPVSGRTGRAHDVLVEQVRRRAPGSSRCRGGRCRPSARRRRRARGRCRPRARRGRSTSPSWRAGRRDRPGSVRWVGLVLRLRVVVVLTGASLAGVVHTAGRVQPSHGLVSGLPRRLGLGQRRTKARTAESAPAPADPKDDVATTSIDDPDPAVQRPRSTPHGGGLPRPDQAADHRAAARHHRAGDVPGRARGAVSLAGRSRPSSAAR